MHIYFRALKGSVKMIEANQQQGLVTWKQSSTYLGAISAKPVYSTWDQHHEQYCSESEVPT